MQYHPLDISGILVYFVAMIAIGIGVMKRASKGMDFSFLAGNARRQLVFQV